MVLIVLVIIVDVLAAYPDDMICQIGERRDNVQVQDELWRRHDPRCLWLILTYCKQDGMDQCNNWRKILYSCGGSPHL